MHLVIFKKIFPAADSIWDTGSIQSIGNLLCLLVGAVEHRDIGQAMRLISTPRPFVVMCFDHIDTADEAVDFFCNVDPFC